MLKKIKILLFIFGLFRIYCNDILIGISKPFLMNNTPETQFYHNHFTFETLFNYSDTDKFKFEILNLNFSKDTKETEYFKNSIDSSIGKELDYLLFSSVYSNESALFFNVDLVNLYDNSIIYSRVFSHKIDYSLKDYISDISLRVINDIKNVKLEDIKNKNKLKSKKENKEREEEINVENIFISESEQRSKHEVFVMNGFFKNHPGIMSFLEILAGYNFSPFEFFSVEGACYIGGGYIESSIKLENFQMNKLFFGGYGGFNLFLSGFIEPSVGLRFEITYIFKEFLYFSFPINIGLKINVNNKNAIRFDASFQFIGYNITELKWENNFIFGFFIGYAKKI